MDNRNPLKELEQLFFDIPEHNKQTFHSFLTRMRQAQDNQHCKSGATASGQYYHAVTESVADLLSVEVVSLMMKSDEDWFLEIKSAKGLESSLIKKSRIKIGGGISGIVAQTGEPLLIEDITKYNNFSNRSRYYTKSLLSVPLKTRGRVIGVLNVNNKTSREIFTQEDLATLTELAHFIAVSIDGILVQDKANTLDIIREDLAHIAHEFRTPLTVIKEIVELMSDEVIGDINDRQRRFLNIVNQSVERLNRMIDNWHGVSRVDHSALHQFKQFNIARVIEDVVNSMDLLADNKGILIKGNVESKDITIWGNEDKITQVITNIIHNAIKYNKPQGKVMVALKKEKDIVIISVADTGRGISKTDLDKIFDKFRSFESRDVEGSGLGLSISKDIIRSHGGRIEVRSKLGLGSTFEIILPIEGRESFKNHHG